VYLYTREFYENAREALAPDGLLCQWVPPHALEPESFVAVLDAFARAFPWSSIWLSGTQVILLGGEHEPELDPARFSVGGDLAKNLEELGLSTPARLLARYVGDGARAREGTRELCDSDPWILYRPRRSGLVLLADPPRNMAYLRSIGARPPRSWVIAAGPGADLEIDGLAALRAAREAEARREIRLRGWTGDAGYGPSLEESLARAREKCPNDPEVSDLEEEIAFFDNMNAGVSLLKGDPSHESARRALPFFLAALRARPARGDVHLYVSVALGLLQDPAADRELEVALRICPGIARTPEGRRARTLGLSDAAWSRAEDSAARQERDFFTNIRFGKSSGVVTSNPQ
jgi:hypothetical protein